MKNLQFRENFQIYIQKSQWKTDFLPICSPIFKDFCHFIHLLNISKFLGLVWRGSSAGLGGVLSILGVGGIWVLYKPLNYIDISKFIKFFNDQP